MPHDQSSDDGPADASAPTGLASDESDTEWEAKWTRRNRSDHLLLVPTASRRSSIDEYIVVAPSTLVDLSEWR